MVTLGTLLLGEGISLVEKGSITLLDLYSYHVWVVLNSRITTKVVLDSYVDATINSTIGVGILDASYSRWTMG